MCLCQITKLFKEIVLWKDDIMMRLSVIVPVYNVEMYLRRGLDSLIEQKYSDLEIILVDDGSTDNSGKICDEYAKKDKRITVIHKCNGGIVSARKAGIDVAKGEYAVNFDPDDWIEIDAYESAMNIINVYQPDIYSFGMVKEFTNFIEKQPPKIDEGFYSQDVFWQKFWNVVSDNYFYTQPILMSQCDKIVKTELFKKHEFNCSEKLKKNVDDAVIFPMLLDMKNIYIDSRCWYHYCVRTNSILWQTKDGDFERYKLLANHLLDSYDKYGKLSDFNIKFLLYKLIHHMILDIPECFLDKDKCKIYPKITHDSKIIIYGKGVFANRLIARINEINYCTIIDNIDSNDVDRIASIDSVSYDYIIVAIFNSQIVKSVLQLLNKLGISKTKIVIIEKESMTSDLLPADLRDRYNSIYCMTEE